MLPCTAKVCWGGSLVILKAFLQAYGMAGVRLGYALSADFTAAGTGLTTAAQSVSVWRRRQTPRWRRRRMWKGRALIAEQRPRLTDRLQALNLRVPGRQSKLPVFRPRRRWESPAARGAVLHAAVQATQAGPGWYCTAVPHRA